MKDPKILIAISKQHSDGETSDEKDEFLQWLNENEKHKKLFNKIETLWAQSFIEEVHPSFLGTFTKKKIQNFIVNQVLGNFVGFVVGVSATHFFTHHVLEKKGLNNLFGFSKRKTVLVNDIPVWLQWTLSVVVGFIVLEFINYLIKTKRHLFVWNYIKMASGKKNKSA